MSIQELAKKIYDDFDPWDRFDYSPEHVEEQIKNDPVAVIAALVEKFID